jgi:hypothetical protein
MTPINHHKSHEVRTAFLVMALLAIAATLIMVGLFGLADDLEPKLGDIISFPPGRVPSISTASIKVSPTNTPSQGTCVLDVQVMQRSGGSLVVEATRRKPGHAFQVHWAGLRTSQGEDDCGSSADFLLNKVQVAALIFAAGGTGPKTTHE